jgi:hypothetical protein
MQNKTVRAKLKETSELPANLLRDIYAPTDKTQKTRTRKI